MSFESVERCVFRERIIPSFLATGAMLAANSFPNFEHADLDSVVSLVPLMPADDLTVNVCSKGFNYREHNKYDSFTYKPHTRTLFTDVSDAILKVTFNHMATDENGDYMIIDEENTIQAVKAYILQEATRPLYYAGEMAQYVFRDIQREYDQYHDAAWNAMAEITPAEVEALINAARKRIDRFKIFK